MGNYVIRVRNYVTASRSTLGNCVIVDSHITEIWFQGPIFTLATDSRDEQSPEPLRSAPPDLELPSAC
jgi:hypothetical protein